ncbi:HNH endonuclease [Streptomyces argyrophyllae]|uniref:HNH endonuclease n=1 Tax=Streptomyces argyrophylli TaxID=2726118 RepID=A0A6M4PDL0_9ACTN|nr:HNH endonuclease [Streptomyces argyrophyllae]
MDHVVPVARGGSWELSNLWVLCAPCHRLKTYGEDRA